MGPALSDPAGLGSALMALAAVVAPLALAWLLIGWGVRRKVARSRPGARRSR